MWDMMLSGPPRLLERREKRMKKNEDPPTSRGRPESIMQDMMLSGPPRLLGLVVQDPIQKYNYRPGRLGKVYLF